MAAPRPGSAPRPLKPGGLPQRLRPGSTPRPLKTPAPTRPVAPAKPVKPVKPLAANGAGSPRLYSIPKTQHELGGTSRSNVYKLIAKRLIKSVKIGRRRMVIASSVDDLIRRAAV
jgi:hypothetical protein